MPDRQFPQDRYAVRTLNGLTWAFTLLLILSTVLMVGLAYFSIKSQTSVAIRESRHLSRSVFADIKERFGNRLVDYSYWDEAVKNLVDEQNAAWADDNIGIYLFDQFGIDASFVISPDNRITYAMIGGKRRSGANPFAIYGENMKILVDKARANSPDGPPQPQNGFVVSADGRLYLASASVLTRFKGVSKHGHMGTGWVLVFLRSLDRSYLHRLGDRYLLPDLSFNVMPVTVDNVAYPIAGQAGHPVGYLSWQIKAELSDTMVWLVPVAGVAFILFGLLALAFFTRTRQIMTLQEESLTAFEKATAGRDLALREARNASQAKSKFLANMSHELRTPLNAIIGMADMMRHEVFGPVGDERYSGYLNDMHASAHHLLQLINDVLDISAIEAGKRNLHKESLDVHEAIEHCLAAVRTAAEDKSISLSINAPDNLPPVFADRRALTQILVNLISNAIKYTGDGGKVGLTVSANTEGHTFVISDNGMGVPEDILPKLTEPFLRAHDRPDIAIEGTGLGLTITRDLLEAHNGTIRFDSAVGVGTTVTIRIDRDRIDQIDLFSDHGMAPD